MANTPSYSFSLPTVGANLDSWGTLLNNNWTKTDNLLSGTDVVNGININSGSIDGTPIGATTPSTIAATAVTATSFTGPLTGNVTGNVTGNLTGNVTGNADSATVLQTTRAFAIAQGPITTAAVNFNGSAEVALTSTLNYDAVYPIGSIYTSVTATNPISLFPNTNWEAFGAGRVMVGLDASDTDFNASEETGGTKDVTLYNSQVPDHNHQWNNHGAGQDQRIDLTSSGGGSDHTYNTNGDPLNYSGGELFHDTWTSPVQSISGSSASENPHTNLQPYIVVYMWKRIANA